MPLKAQPRVGYHSLFALSHRERMMGKLTSGKASGLAGAPRGAFLHHATWPSCRAASANGPSNYRTRLPAGGVVTRQVGGGHRAEKLCELGSRQVPC